MFVNKFKYLKLIRKRKQQPNPNFELVQKDSTSQTNSTHVHPYLIVVDITVKFHKPYDPTKKTYELGWPINRVDQVGPKNTLNLTRPTPCTPLLLSFYYFTFVLIVFDLMDIL